ncbi:MAG: signal peptidase II [Candidatus Yonathbacteria bacterium]|nr:signal peptidase II [Candidatus Yonathbacteria bacterium]
MMWKIAGALLVIDQCFKAFALNVWRSWGDKGVFTFSWNAHTLFYSDLAGLLVALAFMLWLAFKVRKTQAPWAWLLLVGVLSNWIDGVLWYRVIDYLQIPGIDTAFNLADISILCGVFLLIRGRWHGRSAKE